MIKLIKAFKNYEIGEILSLGCVQEKTLIDKGIAIKLKLPTKEYATKGKN